MSKISLTKITKLGQVLTSEEMKHISGGDSDDKKPCTCILSIAGHHMPVNGGTSEQKTQADCDYHCQVVCSTYPGCYSATGNWGKGSGSGSEPGSGSGSLFIDGANFIF